MKVSVIVTAYNRRKYLREAVDSVLDQKVKADEVVVVKNFEDSYVDSIGGNVTVVECGGNLGNQLTKGINKSTGDVLVFLDDDDRFRHNKIEKVKEIFLTDVDYYHNNHILIDDEGNHMKGHMHSPLNFPIKISNFEELRAAISNGNVAGLHSLIFNLSSVAVKRGILQPYLKSLPEFIDGSDWTVFYLSLNEKKVLFFDTMPLTEYRVHSSTSNRIDKSGNSDLISDQSRLFQRKGHYSTVLKTLISGDARKVLNCKLLEEELIMRITKKIKRVRFSEVREYQKCLGITNKRTFKNSITRFAFSFGAYLMPGLTNMLFAKYRVRNYKSKTRKNI